jgi:autotransporter-associated beta strand protein
MKFITQNPTRLLAALAASLLLAAPSFAQTITGAEPVKIFILAGESNMNGKGAISPSTTPGTLDYVVANDPTGRYQFLKSGGSYVTRADVGIRGLVFSGAPNPGNLTIGYGSNSTLIGPELGFGHVIGDAFENKVLLVEVGVDGTTLAHSFCPPSSRVGEPEPLVAADKGFYYKEIIRLVNEAKTALGATPYEIVGLGWHQGWNDRANAPYVPLYEANMANFINDIRSADKGIGVANMPVVIASAAMDWNYGYSEVERAQLKMTDATAYPAFAGNVAVVDTRVPYDGLEFWQPAHNSPANEGFHWNRSGKSFLHIGMAMGDAMTTMVPTRIPFRTRATGGTGGVTLTWNNGTEIPTSVRVLRNGVEIAASAPANPPSFVDATAPLGVNNYELQFTMPLSPCPPLAISHNSGITNLEGNQRVNGLRLTWDNNLGYTGITVKRNGAIIAASLPGTTTSYTDFSPPTGSVTYSVEPVDAGSTPVEVQVTVSAAPAGGALIYEPFEMTADTALAGKNAGIGLDGKWDGDANIQLTSSSPYTFGSPTPLPVFGNRINRISGNGACAIHIGNTLQDAGLMAHGAQLWFSFLCQNPDNGNIHPTLALGDDILTFHNTVAMGGNAIGAKLLSGNKVTGFVVNGGTQTAATATQATLGTSEVVLVVGRITWGANASAPDTIEIYTPGQNLVLDSPQSASAVVDQSKFKVLSMWGNGVAPNMDEIRFGTSYEAVIGQATDTSGDFTPPTPATMSFVTPPVATSTSAITMTATTASDANGVQYFFDETSGNPGGTDSGWQDSATYIDTGLNPNTQYTYTVQARDKSVNNNPNTASSPASATTLPPDNNPPTTPAFATAPNATSFSVITMTATAVTDPEGGPVEYFFTETSGNPGGNSSGWQSSPTYTDSGLNPNTQYTYTVKARDTASPPNESVASASASATTPVKTPTTYIHQNNTSLLNTSSAWNIGDLPLGVDSVQWDATCAGNRSTNLGGDVTWGKIIIATGTAGAVTIGNTAGSTMGLNGVGGTGIDMSAAPQNLTINNPMTLGSSQIWDVTTSRTLTVGNYAIGDGGSGYGITKAGAGTLTLQGSNAFSGPANVTGGTLSISSIANGGNPSPLGQSSNAASNVLLGNGTTLIYTGGAAGSDRSFTINGTAAAHGATINANGSGPLNLTSTSTIGYGTADQTRTLTLTGANNLANTHVLAAQLTNNGSGAVTLSKTGTGSVWHLTNPNNSFTGGVTFNRGFLVFSSGALGTTGNISVGANSAPPFGLRWAPGNTDDISRRFNNPAASTGQVTLDTGASNVVFANEIGLKADSWVIKEGSGSLTLNTASGWGNGANAATLVNAGMLVAKVMANGGTKSSIGNTSNSASAFGLRGGALKYTGSGATTDRNFHLSGDNTLDASGTGALVFAQTGAISPTPASRTFLVGSGASIGNATVTSSDLVPGMAVSGSGIQAGSKIVSIGINGTIVLDKTPTYAGGTLTFGSYLTGTLTLTGTSTHANEIKGILKDSTSAIPGDTSFTALGIDKIGGGKWVLSGANTYTGPTNLNGGTLALGANHVLPDASPVTLAATLDAGTFSDTLGTLDVAGAASINLGSGATLAFAASNGINSGTWSGTLNITGTFGATSIRFGTTNTALTAGQLSKITVNGSGDWTLDSNGYLVAASVASGYNTWASSKGLTGLPGSSTDPAKDADPDKDGRNNLGEFAFNGAPLSGSDNGKVFVLAEDSDSDGDSAKELIFTVAVRSGTPVFAGSPLSATHGSDGITYSIEGSLDLAVFATAVNVVPTPLATGLPAAGTGYEYRSFSLNGSNGLIGKGFLRAKVTSP